jgi:hypothetical protein
MRSARLALLVTVTLGVVGLATFAIVRQTSLAFTLGVAPAAPVAELRPSQSVCQRPIDVPAHGEFDRIRLTLGTFGKSGPPIAVAIRSTSGTAIGRGRLAGGYPDVEEQLSHVVRVTPIHGRQRIEVCLSNRGSGRVAIYGNADAAARSSSAYTGSRRLAVDLGLRFERHPRSLASLTLAMFDRAALFRTPIAGAWLYIVLAAVVLLLVPFLLIRALDAAGEDSA